MMKPEIAQGLIERALALHGGPAEAELVEDGGKWIVLRHGGEVAEVFKVIPRFGPARGDGQGNFVVSSMSLGLKRMKRIPKGIA